jgi:serine/threonine-protein kinase
MSPEQIRSTAEVHHPTDIWSLGAVLYELITGRSAFVADSVAQVWNRILETNPGPLAHYCPHAPAELQAVIDRCLEKEPSRRFKNVAELALALQSFAPSRARLHAQRASSILGGASDSVYPAATPSMASLRATARSSRPPQSFLMLSEPATPPASSRQSWSVSTQPSRGRWAVLGLVGAVLIVVGLFAMPAAQLPLAQPPEAPAVLPAAAPTLEPPAVELKPAPPLEVPEAAPTVEPLPEPRAAPLDAPEVALDAPAPARTTKASRAALRAAARKNDRARALEDSPAAAASAHPVKVPDALRAAEPAPPAAARLVDDAPRVRLIQDDTRAQLLD